MLKTFFVGILLGLAAAVGALYAFPVVDQVRETSIVSVAPNGGNVETFRINVPMDRVLIGAHDRAASLPPGLAWPTDATLSNLRSEIFKIRNEHDAVVGVAVRTAVRDGGDHVIDWMLDLPARGSLFVNVDATPREGGYRIGEIRSGSREFEPLNGFLSERWVENTSGGEEAPAGHIELVATYVGQHERRDPDEEAIE